MNSAVERLGRPLPRSFQIVGLPLIFVLLTAFFVFLGFPYERVAGGLIAQVEASTGLRLEIEDLGPYLSPFGPGFQATQVVAVPKDGGMIQIDHVRLRPAWSASWLRGDPAVHVGLDSALGAASGALTIGDRFGYDGELEGVDLGAPAIANLLPFEGLDGSLWADADVEIVDGLPDGQLEFRVGDGSVAIPNSPLAIPFDSIEGEMFFGGESTIRVDLLEVLGPMLDAQVTGRVGDGSPNAQLSRAPLDLQVDLQVKGKAAQSTVRNAGVRLDRDGKASMKVGGNLSSPRVR
ncbi:MAG: type II secretion system protein GspN [Myxococcota bacterium]